MPRYFPPESGVPYIAALPKDYTGAALTADYVSMKTFAHLAIVIVSGAWAGGTAAVTLSQATAVAGTSAKALGFSWMWTDIASSGTFVKTAVAANTFNLGTANSVWVINVTDDMLDVDNGFDCVALAVASPGANNDLYAAVYLPSETRYARSMPDTVHVD
jgi:hypothetical protein